jgi:hypothetical protein
MIAPATVHRHEPSGLSLKGLGIFLVIFIGTAIVLHVGVGLLLWTWTAGRPSPGAQIDPAAQRQILGWTDPTEELRLVNQAADARLHGYGWMDRERGIVRIPIERAMELIVQEAGNVAAPRPAAPDRAIAPEGRP